METKPLCFIYLEIIITISLKTLKYICFLLLRAKKWYLYHYFLGVCESWLEWLFTKRKQKAEKNSLLEQQPMWSAGNTMYKDYYKIQKHSFEGELKLHFIRSTIRAVSFRALDGQKIVSSANHLVESLLHKSKSRYA